MVNKNMKKTIKKKRSKVNLSITNFDESDSDLEYENKSDLLPQWCFRYLIVGKSGAGKTMLGLSFLGYMLDYDTITLCCKHPDQGKLRKLVQGIKMAGMEDNLIICENVEDLPEVESYDKSKQNILFVDDMINEPQKRLIDFAVRGRLHGVSMIYLTQSYYKVPRIIRLQCTDFSFFEMNRKEVRLIYEDIGNDIEDLNLFRRMFMDATTNDFGFLHVDKRTRDKRLKYRRGFDRDIHTNEKLN